MYPLEVVPSFLGCRAARDCAHAVWLACQRKSWIRRRTLIAFGRSVSVFVFTDVGRCSRHCLCELIDSRFFLAAWRSPFRARSGNGCRATLGTLITWQCLWPSRGPSTGVAAPALPGSFGLCRGGSLVRVAAGALTGIDGPPRDDTRSVPSGLAGRALQCLRLLLLPAVPLAMRALFTGDVCATRVRGASCPPLSSRTTPLADEYLRWLRFLAASRHGRACC